jgi:hypothetical protein
MHYFAEEYCKPDQFLAEGGTDKKRFPFAEPIATIMFGQLQLKFLDTSEGLQTSYTR